jgi:hypothetical protein
MENEALKDITLFQIKRKITNIYKNFFFILEDLGDSGYNINNETYQKMRKRILDNANDAFREIEESFSKLNITLK